jgi:hypothetical protein
LSLLEQIIVLLALVLKLMIQGILKDGSLGSLGVLVGFIGAVLMPWPQNTITYYVGTTLVTPTMNSYQHPERVGIRKSENNHTTWKSLRAEQLQLAL